MKRRVQKPEVVRQKLQAAVWRHALENRSILLAVSGGGDSMALLDAAAREAPGLGLRLAVACVDHHLRRASKRERALVAAAAEKRGLPFHPLDAPVAPGPGVEARAREARYAALEQARAELGFDRVATAHTASDQAETVLMRLSRGSALTGASGIREVRGTLVRPLLDCTREELRAYLRRHRIRFAEDVMNRDPAFLRTRIRRRVLPALEEAAGPEVVLRWAGFARVAAEDDALLSEWAAASLRRLRVPGGLDAVGLRALARPVRRRVLARLLSEEGLAVDLELVERMDDAVTKGLSTPLPERATLRAEGAQVRIVRAETGAALAGGWPPRDLTCDGDPVRLPELGLEVAWRSTPPSPEARGRAQPLWVAPQPGLVLQVRPREPGDRVEQASGRTRKLQDVLTDARVPREQRDRIPVIAAPSGRVVCAVGVWPSFRRGTEAAARSWVEVRTAES